MSSIQCMKNTFIWKLCTCCMLKDIKFLKWNKLIVLSDFVCNTSSTRTPNPYWSIDDGYDMVSLDDFKVSSSGGTAFS